MAADELICRLRGLRTAAGLSQQALADEVGVSRQAIVAIESGRQVPATTLALRLARALATGVEELFALAEPGTVHAHTAGPVQMGGRLRMGRVDGRWVVHALVDESGPSDAVASSDGEGRLVVEPLVDLAQAENNVLAAGCAPLLGNLTARIGARFGDARGTWLGVGSGRALDLLEAGLVHVAGVHLGGESAEEHAALARRLLGHETLAVVNLAVWRQGLVFRRDNPRGIDGAADLLRDDVRVARRENGSGAATLLERLLDAEPHGGPLAAGHEDVARLVQWGIVDVGVAIESVAVAYDLAFLPLSEERFDLVIPQRHLDRTPVARLLEGLHDASFRRDAALLPGYDLTSLGDLTTVGAP